MGEHDLPVLEEAFRIVRSRRHQAGAKITAEASIESCDGGGAAAMHAGNYQQISGLIAGRYHF